VQVGDWQSWKPTNGTDIGELQSNLTSVEVEKLAIALDPCDDEKEDDEYRDDDVYRDENDTIVVEGM
jgi:hypothetical protein